MCGISDVVPHHSFAKYHLGESRMSQKNFRNGLLASYYHLPLFVSGMLNEQNS